MEHSNSTVCPSIDDFRNQVYSTAYCLITVFGLTGNGFALVVLILMSHQSSPFNVYMLNLAVSDLLCVSTLPLRVLYYVNKGQWNQGDFLCRISSYTLYVNLYCSIYFMAAMSVTRFVAIVFPMQSLQVVTVSRSRLMCVSIWIFICLASSPFLMTGQRLDPVTNKTKCFEPPQGQGVFKVVMLNNLSLVLGFLLPFLVILLCYTGILHTLLTRTPLARSQQDTTSKAVCMIGIILLTFLISFMPYHVQRSIHINSLSRTDTSCAERVAMQKSVVVTLCLAAANSCFDPLLYFFSGEGVRNQLSSMRLSWTASTRTRSLRLNAAGVESGDHRQLCATSFLQNRSAVE
uniref:cysteinyl leukotriene receptor 1 n=1 Tax=Doryrhamphus excisus TaxID=161450 RepID=UPI0025ADEFC4|nr:cysteinyl leukotriene receptor 1 [Doryrhamphus excisus]